MFSLWCRQIALLLKAPLQLEDLRLAEENPRLASRPLPLRSLRVRVRITLAVRGSYDGTATFRFVVLKFIFKFGLDVSQCRMDEHRRGKAALH